MGAAVAVINESNPPDWARPALYTIPEAARALRLSRSTLYILIARGELDTVTVGRLRRVPAAAIDAYVAGLSGAPTGGSAA